MLINLLKSEIDLMSLELKNNVLEYEQKYLQSKDKKEKTFFCKNAKYILFIMQKLDEEFFKMTLSKLNKKFAKEVMN